MTQSSSIGPRVNHHQFLAASLSPNGSNSLPYGEESRRLIHDHVTALTAAFPSLRPSTGTFTYNDGTTVTLLYVKGTISILSMSTSNELPLYIWLHEAYPAVPPSVFVAFPHGTAPFRRHRLVDASGAVTVPCLTSWDFQYSNLVDLVRSINRLLNNEPPFYVTDEAKKMSLLSTVSKTVVADLEAMGEGQVAELELLFEIQSVLKNRTDVIRRGVRKLEDQRDQLEQQLQTVLMNCDVLRVWVQDSFQKLRRCSTLFDIDEAFVPADSASRLKMECIAADKAVEDTIYELDSMLREGCIGYTEYLKSVRSLSREQFFHRAKAMKLGIHV